LAGESPNDAEQAGSAVVETAAHDLGTGTYTVMQQVAAETLGLRRTWSQ
jgi:CO/xanthine dehydrogenase Mo-binding subunit